MLRTFYAGGFAYILAAVSATCVGQAAAPTFEVTSAALVHEVHAGSYQKLPSFGWLLIEVRGNLHMPAEMREFPLFTVDLAPRPREITLGAYNEFGLLGVGVVDRNDEVVYPFLQGMGDAAKPQTFTAKGRDGAEIEVRSTAKRVDGLKLLTADTPLAIVFGYPVPGSPELKLQIEPLNQTNLRAALPPITVRTEDLGWPVPDKKKKEADRTFAAGLPFYIWTATPLVQANENYLRFAVNPKLTLDTVPNISQLATKAVMQVTQKGLGGQPVEGPLTTIANESFGLQFPGGQYQGRGKATLTILKRSADPKAAERAPPLSNSLSIQISFDPPKSKSTRPTKGRTKKDSPNE